MKWFKLEDCLPPVNRHVLVTNGKDFWIAARFKTKYDDTMQSVGDEGYAMGDYDEPTHWMVLPKLPEENGDV